LARRCTAAALALEVTRLVRGEVIDVLLETAPWPLRGAATTSAVLPTRRFDGLGEDTR